MAYLTRYSNLTVATQANLGSASDVKIGGGLNGYILSTDGLGNLSWETKITPAGNDSFVQFNDNGNFGANVGFTFDKNTGTLATPAVTCDNLVAAGGSATINGNWELAEGATLVATYADLGERYSSDQQYPPGTVVMIGGEREVTIANYKGRTKIAGIVSTNPAYILNSNAENSVIVALTGRVPCRVTGPVSRGDFMTISKTPGVACAAAKWVGGTIIGRALSDYTGEGEGVIEVKVDRG
jgi:hypothetical protein